MLKPGPWAAARGASGRSLGLPFWPSAAAPAGRPPSGLAARRDRLMAERDRLSREIAYMDSQSLPRARQTALAAVALAESRMTEAALERASVLGGMVDAMAARGDALRKELADARAGLCETLEAMAADGRAR